MKRIPRKTWLNALLLMIVFALTIYSVFNGEDPVQIANALSLANPLYVAAGVMCVVLFILG